MPYAKSYKNLEVYQLTRDVSRRFFEQSKLFPKEERYSLTDQGRRSPRSVGAQIAEAWAKRRYARHFVSKLTDADGEQQETQHWVETAFDCGYINKKTRDEFIDSLQCIGRMLNSMIAKAHLFCGESSGSVCEEAEEYYVIGGPITDNR